MHKGNRVGYVIMALFIQLCATPCVLALDKNSAAINALRYQVQLISLIDPSFSKYNQLLTQDLEEEQLDLTNDIQLEVANFWRSVKIQSRGEGGSDDLYRNVISLEPSSSDYLPISNRIRYLLWVEQTESWQPLVLDIWLKEGDINPAVKVISRRLNWLGDLNFLDPDNSVMTSELVRGVLNFQRRHGLKQDGVIGPETLRWINLTPKKRAALLAENFISKSSYLSTIGPRFLLVNIPAFEMVLVDKGQVQLESRVIVGKPYRQTPRLSSYISNMVLNPSWRVPRTLLRRDLLPKVRKDGAYISEHNFDVFNSAGDEIVKSPEEWQTLAGGRFPYRLVQKPGKDNTLGRYKFYFKNEYNVYLHDTYDKALFEESNRALSSGCIRVEKVESLANWLASNLVSDKQTWVDLQTERDKTQWFAFDNFLAVHLVYWTAWVDESGLAQFRNDIYHQNSMPKLASIQN
ncbi:L,D-transpeptidase family protein [Shewanella woodyi]|uniref:Peptidoglycan-binding domain 1 protein n=1 Tax=Shewanella woodyi (strain ATCC 51908 / MS32) TaxID=392500 RepID=B1KDP0_SHEWM|nr:L,D-transpeptidase family protein [Shewanella woodyi]ACA86437.1 Peptidoglycan-binding domain 1 protein [Shewanella woodyi ATCC 51908]